MNRWRYLSRFDYHKGWLRLGRRWYGLVGCRLVTVPLITGGMTDPTVDQNVWARILDDGDEAGSTISEESTSDGGWTQTVDEVFRVRFEMVHTAGDAANGRTWQLQFDLNSVGFVNVTASTPIQGAASAETSWTISDGDDTTDRLAGDGGTFEPGLYTEADGLSNNTNVGATDHNEMEFCVTIDSAQVSDEDTIALRVVMSGAVTELTYGATPTITVDDPAGAITRAPGVGTLALAGQVPSPGFGIVVPRGQLVLTSPPGPMASALLDDFNRADEGPPPSSEWENSLFPSTDGMVVSTNQMAPDSVNRCAAFWSTPPGFNYDTFITIATRPADFDQIDINVARNSAADYDGYTTRIVRDDSSGDVISLRRWDDGSSTELGTATVTFADGDAIGLRRVGDRLESWYRPTGGAWRLVIEASDATYNIADAKMGVLVSADPAQTVRFDDFSGGATSPTLDFGLHPNIGALVFASQAINPLDYRPASGQLVFAGQAPIVLSALTIDVPTGALVLAGQVPIVLGSIAIDVPVGALVFGSDAPVVISAKIISPGPGLLVLVGPGSAPLAFGVLMPVDSEA